MKVRSGQCIIAVMANEEPEEELSRKDRIDEAWDALDDGDLDSAVATALALVNEDDSDAEALYLAGSALLEAERFEEAEPHLRRAAEIDPDDLDAQAALAQLLYESCRFDEAREEVEAVLKEDPKDAYMHHLSARLAERRGEWAASEEEDRVAQRLAPDDYPLPIRFERGEFDDAVEAAIGELPPLFREKMANLAVIVEDLPSDDHLRLLEDPTPGLLGLFVGTPLPEKSLGDLPRPPDAVYLFKRNLERICESRGELIEEIRITLLHEVGHFMGLEEDQIADAGYE